MRGSRKQQLKISRPGSLLLLVHYRTTRTLVIRIAWPLWTRSRSSNLGCQPWRTIDSRLGQANVSEDVGMRPGKKRHGPGKILYGGSSSGMYRVRQWHSCNCVDLANPFILDRHATYCASCAVHNLESASYAPQAPSMLKYTCRWHVVTGPPHHHSLVQRLNWMLFRCSCISLFWRAMPRQYPA